MLQRSRQINYKTDRELERMRVAGRMVAEVHKLMQAMVAPGVTTGDLNEAAHAKMKEMGGIPSFLGYVVGGKAYPAVLCISIDDEVVHGIPGRCMYRGKLTPDRKLEEGQVVSIDCGVIYQGYHGDSAVTLPVGKVAPEVQELLTVCREALWAGIRKIRPGGKLSEVASAIEGEVRRRENEKTGRYGIVEEYVGHGIGTKLHEDPQVPNFCSPQLLRNDLVLKKGLVVAIEPMVNLGTHKTRTLADGWTVVTKDKKPSAHFEHTVAVTDDGFEVLTLREDGGATH
ncbi:MAG: type I methionyl aminopeptidase [Planctomycetes bacterium]|nr:type I methionyl aminopeptidase [Planctomycetota bacterium]